MKNRLLVFLIAISAACGASKTKEEVKINPAPLSAISCETIVAFEVRDAIRDAKVPDTKKEIAYKYTDVSFECDEGKLAFNELIAYLPDGVTVVDIANHVDAAEKGRFEKTFFTYFASEHRKNVVIEIFRDWRLGVQENANCEIYSNAALSANENRPGAFVRILAEKGCVEDALKVSLALLPSDFVGARENACHFLGKLGNESHLPSLEAMRDDKSYEVTKTCADAVKKIKLEIAADKVKQDNPQALVR